MFESARRIFGELFSLLQLDNARRLLRFVGVAVAAMLVLISFRDDVPWYLDQPYASFFAIVTIIGFGALEAHSLRILRRARDRRVELFATNESEVATTQPYALFLRSFSSDDQLRFPFEDSFGYLPTVLGTLRFKRETIENRIAGAISPNLTLIKIGEGAEEELGAGTLRTTDEEWFDQFIRLCPGAHVVIIVPMFDRASATYQEFNYLVQNQFLDKLVLVMPPEYAPPQGDDWEEVPQGYAERWAETAQYLHEDFGIELPDYDPKGALVVKYNNQWRRFNRLYGRQWNNEAFLREFLVNCRIRLSCKVVGRNMVFIAGANALIMSFVAPLALFGLLHYLGVSSAIGGFFGAMIEPFSFGQYALTALMFPATLVFYWSDSFAERTGYHETAELPQVSLAAYAALSGATLAAAYTGQGSDYGTMVLLLVAFTILAADSYYCRRKLARALPQECWHRSAELPQYIKLARSAQKFWQRAQIVLAACIVALVAYAHM